tara:strand:- start:456 stop:1211 length:756 start_codon:yes stop_codon:yes gene_type:complete
MAYATSEKLKPLQSWEDGLNPTQTAAVTECIKTVATTTAGTYKQLAAAFNKVKDALPERNWTKWTNTVVLNVGARTIQELAGANAWLQSTTVSDEVIGKLAARTISMIAQAGDKQSSLEARLKSGEILTVSSVKIALEGEPKASNKLTPKQVISELEGKLVNIERQYDSAKEFLREQVLAGDRVREERDLALAKIEELERQLNALTNALNSGENSDVAIPFNLETLRGATPDDWTASSNANSRTKSKESAA